MKNRVISLLLVLCMLLTAVPAVSAEETASTPKFTAYNLVLNESIAVNFKLSNYDGKNFDKVEFIMDGAVKQTIDELPKKSGDVYVFRFTELSPDQLAKEITVNFYLENEAAPVASATSTVRKYAESILSSPAHGLDIKAVIMDMLNYGEAFQQYKATQAGVKLDPTELITYALNNAYRGYATQKTPILEDITELGDQTGMSVQWIGLGLNLGDVVAVFYDFDTESVEGLTLKLTVDGTDFEVTSFETVTIKDKDGNVTDEHYRARFDKLNPVQMKEAIDAQFYKDGAAVSAKYTTSIESYAARATDTSVQTVVAEMMKYGTATEVWVEGSEDDGTDEPEIVTPRTEIYVDSKAPVGEGDGSIEKPLANIVEARDMIRAMKASGKYPEEGGVTVYFREGTYMFSDTAYFNAEDAGTAESPIVYKAYDKEGTKEKVSFVGGLSFDVADFVPVTDEAVKARLADPAHTKQLDLKAQGLYDYGQLHVYGMAASYFTMAGIPIQTQAAPELFFGDQAMQLAKYPDGENTWLKIATVKQVGDVIQNWNHSTAHGNNYIPPENRPPVDQIRNSIFTVQDSVTERWQKWSQADNIWVYGWWEVDYSDQSMPVKSLTVDDNGTGVVETGIPSGKKITAGRRFYFYNLLEEITVPGEYYIDRENGILYAYLPSETGSISYGSLDGPVIKLGGGCQYMTVEGINFSTGQTNGIDVDGAENIVLKNLDVSGFTQKGITLSNCRDVLVTGCHVHQTGSGGITMSYSSAKEPYASAIKTLTPLNVIIEHCEVHDYSRISKTYSAGISTAGIGTIVRNCKIYNGDHYAIALNGNDTLIEYCEVFNVLRSAGDSGVIYNGFSKQEEGQVVRNCYFHDIGSGTSEDVSVVYMDDTKDGVTFESNLLVNIGGRGFFMNGGWNNKAQNNIMINVKTEGLLGDMGMGGTSRYDLDAGNYEGFWKIYNHPEIYTAHSKYEHWNEKGTLLRDTEFYNAPHYNVIQNNILIDVTNVVQVSTTRGSSAWNDAKSREFNSVSNGIRKTLAEAGFVDAANGNFALAEDSSLKDILGEKAPDFANMGRYYQVEKPAGYGGTGYAPVTPPVYEGEDYGIIRGPLLDEDFSEDTLSTNWTFNGATLTEGGALEVAVGYNKTANHTVRFKEYAGKIQYELDYKVDFGTCTSIDSGIIIVKGINAAGAEKSLFNLQAKPNANFGAYDGGGGTRNAVKVESNKLYRIKVICDPVTDTYDFYVDGQPVIIGGKMRSDAGDVKSFIGICIDQKSNTTADSVVTFTYDNILITAVGYQLYREDFTSPYAKDSFTGSGGKLEQVEGKLVLTMESTGQANYVAPISEYKGIVTFETDFSVDLKGNTGKGTDGKDLMDSGTILIKGKDTSGSEKSLLNLKVRASSKTFGAYDGDGDHETEVKFEENKTYRIKVVCDPYTDTYKMYADDVLVMEGKLRNDAVSFTGICINQNRKGGDTAPVFTYDNMLAYTGDGSVIKAPEKEDDVVSGDSASLLYEEYFTDPSSVDSWKAGAPSGDDIVINDAGQLQITKNVVGSINSNVVFKDAVTKVGKVTYEIDFSVDLNGCLDVDPNIFVVRGNGGTASLLNLKVYIDQTTGKMVFGAYDGTPNPDNNNKPGAEHPSTVECVEGKMYRITVICDTASDTYDFYADGVEVFKGAPLRSDATNFSGLQMTLHKKNSCEHEGRAVVCLDNIRAYAGAKNPSSGLYQEDFSDPSTVDSWKAGAPAADDIVINDAGQLQVTKNTTGDFAPSVAFDNGATQVGKITYEVDFRVDLNGCLDVDPNIFIVKGNGGTKSLLNPKIYIKEDGKMVFGAYDGTNGGAEHESTVECVAGKTHHITIICDTASDLYDFYVDGVEVFKGAPLRYDATNFSGLQLCIHKSSSCEHDAPVVYFDNFAVWAGDIYSGETGGEEEEPDEPEQPAELGEAGNPVLPKNIVLGEKSTSDYSSALELSSSAKVYTLEEAVAGKVAIQYQIGIVSNDAAFKVKSYFKGETPKTMANVNFKGGIVDAKGSVNIFEGYKNNTWYTVLIFADFDAKTYDVYLDGKLLKADLVFDGAETNLKTLHFQIDGGTGTAHITNVAVYAAEEKEVTDEPGNPMVPEGITLGDELATDYDGNTIEMTSGAKYVYLTTAATGKVAIQYKTKVVTTGEGFQGKGFFKGTTPGTTTFANVTLMGGNITTNGVGTGATYEDDTWYNVFIVLDIDAKTYDVYLDGKLIKEDRAWENGATTTDLKQLCFQADVSKGGPGTVWFEDIAVHQVTAIAEPEQPGDSDEPDAEIKEVLAFEDFSNGKSNWSGGTVVDGALEVTQAAGGSDVYIDFNNADFKAEIAKANAANKELLVEFDIALKSGYDATAFEAGFMLKNSADSDKKTAIEAVIKDGKLRTGYTILAEEAVEDDTFYKIQIICDPATKTIKFYIDGQPLTLTGGYLNSQATWDMVRLMVKGNKGSKDLTIAIDNFKVSLYDGTPIQPEDTTKYPEATKGKKALVLGDSLTSAGQWQTKLITELGMSVETHALGGLSMTAIIDGGTVNDRTLPALTAQQVADKDLIVFYAGYNNRHQSAAEFAATLTTSINKIKALLTTAGNADCKIMIVTPHFVGKSQYLYGSSVPLDGDDVPPAGSPSATVSLKTLVAAMVAEANKIGIPVYDLFNNSDIGPETWNTYSAQKADENGYVSGTTNWADQVHLNSTGYAHIGELIADFVLENWNYVPVTPEPETPAFPEDIVLGEELATQWDGNVLELTAGQAKKIALNATASGKVAIQYKIKVDRTADGLQGKAYFKEGQSTTTFANVTFNNGVISTNGNADGMTGNTYADGSWYNVLIVMDLGAEAPTYDVYLNGTQIRAGRPLENSIKSTGLGYLCFEAGKTNGAGAGTVSFDEIKVHQVVDSTTPDEPAEPTGTVVYTNTFDNEEGQVLTLTSSESTVAQKMYTLTTPATGKITIEYKVKVVTESNSFNAKAFFKPAGTGNPPTFINIGLSGGNVNLTGDAYKAGEWNTVKIVADMDNKTYNVFLNDTSLTPDGKSWTADANNLCIFYLCAELAAGTAYFDDVIVTAFSQ